MRRLTGTWRLFRLAARRDRIRLTVWLLAIVGLATAIIQGLSATYGDKAADQAMYMQVLETSAVGRIFTGVPGEVSFGGVVTAESLLYVALAVVFMNVLLVVRHTRANEENGSAELVQSAQVGRFAALTATMLFALVANMVVVAGLAAMMSAFDGISIEQAWAYGFGMGAVGLCFAGIAGVTAQLSSSARGATSLAAILIGVAFMVRGVGDVFATNADGVWTTHWVTWLSPLGWLQQLKPLGDDIQWWAMGLLLGLALVCGVAAYALLAWRDVGAGLLAARSGRSRASSGLTFASPLGLAWHMQRWVFVGWLAMIVIFAGTIGGMAEQVLDMAKSSEVIQSYLAAMGDASGLVDSTLSALMPFMMIIVAAYVVQAAGKIRSEEMSGRLEGLLSTPLSRWRWICSHLIVIASGAIVLTVLTGVSIAVTAGLSMGDAVGDWQAAAYAAAGLSYVPAILVLLGLMVFLTGVAPRFAMAGSWIYFAYVVIVSQLGGILKLPDWAMDMSPLQHVTLVPYDDIAWRSLWLMVVVVMVLIAVGLITLRRRDVQAR